MTGHGNLTLPIAADLVAAGRGVTHFLPEAFRDQIERPCPITAGDNRHPSRIPDPVERFALVPTWPAEAGPRISGIRQLPDPRLFAAIDGVASWGRLRRPGGTNTVGRDLRAAQAETREQIIGSFSPRPGPRRRHDQGASHRHPAPTNSAAGPGHR
jgi:hypothetical protein